jgi:hypothetical protein
MDSPEKLEENLELAQTAFGGETLELLTIAADLGVPAWALEELGCLGYLGCGPSARRTFKEQKQKGRYRDPGQHGPVRPMRVEITPNVRKQPQPNGCYLPPNFHGPLRPQKRSSPKLNWPWRDGSGRIIGFGRRYEDGSKITAPGSRLGLIYCDAWLQRPGPIFMPEGLSDTAVLWSLGLCAVGRPNNRAGVEHLTELLKQAVKEGRRLVVVADGDRPGWDGANYVAQQLANNLRVAVEVALPPEGDKDVRQWFNKVCWDVSDPSILAEMRKRYLRWASPVAIIEPSADSKWMDEIADLEGVEFTHILDGNTIWQPIDPLEGFAEEFAAAVADWRKEAAEREAQTRANRASFLASLSPEALAAEMAAENCRDFGRFPCVAIRPIVAEFIDTKDPVLLDVRCKRRRECDGCRHYLIERDRSHAWFRIAQHVARGAVDGRLYELRCQVSEWNMIRRQIIRRRGQYLRLVESIDELDGDAPAVFWVLTTVEIPGGSLGHTIPIGSPHEETGHVAIGEVEALLCAYRGQRHPMTTSRGWRAPRRSRGGIFRRHGPASPFTTDALVDAIAAMKNATVTTSRPREAGRSNIQRTVRFLPGTSRGKEWRPQDEADRLHIIGMLLEGEVYQQVDFGGRRSGCEGEEQVRARGAPRGAPPRGREFMDFELVT